MSTSFGLVWHQADNLSGAGRSLKTARIHLEGTLWGEPVDVERHAPGSEPKGATYTALKVAKEPDGRWSAGCVVDV